MYKEKDAPDLGLNPHTAAAIRNTHTGYRRLLALPGGPTPVQPLGASHLYSPIVLLLVTGFEALFCRSTALIPMKCRSTVLTNALCEALWLLRFLSALRNQMCTLHSSCLITCTSMFHVIHQSCSVTTLFLACDGRHLFPFIEFPPTLILIVVLHHRRLLRRRYGTNTRSFSIQVVLCRSIHRAPLIQNHAMHMRDTVQQACHKRSHPLW